VSGSRNRIGISTAAFYPDRLTEDALVSIADLGFQVVEIFLQAEAEYTPRFGAVLDRRCRDVGLDVHSLHLYSSYFDLWSPYPRTLQENRDRFLRLVEMAALLDAEALTWHGLRYGLEDEDLIAAFFESAGWAGERAQDADLVLTLENVSWCYVRRPEHVRTVRRAALPVGFTFDAFQARESDVDPAEMVDAMGKELVTVHLSDYRPDGPRHLPPGAGDIDWPVLALALRRVDYGGPLILETADVSDPSVFLEARKFVRRVWERAADVGD
jgi:sugar phosphate isomerase/epimerase